MSRIILLLLFVVICINAFKIRRNDGLNWEPLSKIGASYSTCPFVLERHHKWVQNKKCKSHYPIGQIQISCSEKQFPSNVSLGESKVLEVEQFILSHSGRTIWFTGDSILEEYGSALKCLLSEWKYGEDHQLLEVSPQIQQSLLQQPSARIYKYVIQDKFSTRHTCSTFKAENATCRVCTFFNVNFFDEYFDLKYNCSLDKYWKQGDVAFINTGVHYNYETKETTNTNSQPARHRGHIARDTKLFFDTYLKSKNTPRKIFWLETSSQRFHGPQHLHGSYPENIHEHKCVESLSHIGLDWRNYLTNPIVFDAMHEAKRRKIVMGIIHVYNLSRLVPLTMVMPGKDCTHFCLSGYPQYVARILLDSLLICNAKE
mmetsp:Transcript_39496/g.126037  ORF Transcript_39496/g.126037 Transcript_39496/m.126037 type:complete len:372 (-) Transcript_39496:202-1317(-)